MNKEKQMHNPQKKVWKDDGIFNTYEEAKNKSDSLETESKVRRCGPNGTKFKVKETGEIVILEEIRNYPTRYKVKNSSGKINYYKTFDVEMVEESTIKS